MQSYAASTNALLSDKLSVVLNDWAKAKAAYYDMDNKIALVCGNIDSIFVCVYFITFVYDGVSSLVSLQYFILITNHLLYI